MGPGGFLQKAMTNVTKSIDKLVTKVLLMEKSSERFEKNYKKAADHISKASGGKSGNSELGLGSFDYTKLPTTRTEKIAGGIGLAATTVGIGMGVMPNTMSAVNLRMAADTVSGLSGMSSASAIARANQAVAGGATSATGPTMALASAAYGGGYLASSLSSKNIMASVGGLSALTGGSNEQVAGALSQMNGMAFLRMGVQIRDKNGQLKPIPTIINDVYRFLFGARTVTADQVFTSVMNPGGKGYQSLLQITGGNQDLMAQIQMGLVARARNNKPLDKNAFSGPSNALNLMGVGQDSPIRSQFKYNTSEANLLQSTQQGLVGGYNTSLNAVSAANNGLADFAKMLPQVTNLLGGLKGVLQTIPGLGGIGGTAAGLTSTAVGLGYGYMQNKAMMEYMTMLNGGKGIAGTGGSVEEAIMNPGGYKVGAANASRMTGLMGKLGKASGFALLASLLGMAKGPLDKTGLAKDHPLLKMVGNTALNMGKDAAIGAALGSFLPGAGTAIGAVGGTLFGLVSSLMHGGGGNTTPGMGTSDSSSHSKHPYTYPTPTHQVSSGFGYRKDPHNPSKNTMHSGLDYAVKKGTPVKAAGDGVVTHAGMDKDYGRYVIITHGKKSTLYAHLSSVRVRPGQKVSQGEEIGRSGGKPGDPGSGNSTGPHLHFEIRDNGGPGAQGRVDPKKYVNKDPQYSPPLPSTPPTKAQARYIAKHYGVGAAKDISDLQSEGISSKLIAGLESGIPMNYNDLIKILGNNSQLKATDGSSLIDGSTNLVSGELKHIVPGGSREGYMRMLYQAGFRGKGLQTAFAVSMAESKLDPGALGDIKLEDKKWGPSVGLFQIRSLRHWENYDGKGSSDPYRDAKRLINPRYNIKAAWEKSNHGTNWDPWSTYTGGEFIKYLDDAARTSKNLNYGIGGSDAPGMALASVSTSPHSSRSISSATMHASQTVTIKVDMHVNIQNASYREAIELVDTFHKQLNNKLKVEGIGMK